MGEWIKLHNEKLNDLYYTPNIVQVKRVRRMRWAVHVARMEERRGVYRFCWRNLKERGHLGDPAVDERIVNRSILRKLNVHKCTGSIWLSIGTGDGHL